MSSKLNRRRFIKKSLLTSAGGAAFFSQARAAYATPGGNRTAAQATLPQGQISGLRISRLLLGGNLLTHYTHSRDLRYVYNLTAHYNTEQKIHETMALAEQHGVNTLVIHTAPGIMDKLKRYRYQLGGKMQWIICPTAEIDATMKAYADQAKQIVDDGTEAIYLWGVRSDALVVEGKIDLIRKAVEIAKDLGVPSGVGAHDLRVIIECERHNVPADFYIKTFHHHNYPSAPKAHELVNPYNEVPGYWCKDPQQTIEIMKNVTKPWIAFKVMAAGAIPPQDAFKYVIENGADHVLAGMFDFEIAEDVQIANKVLAEAKRTRAWRS